MDNYNLVYDSWDKISISLYKQILEATEMEVSPMEINLSVLALLMGVDEDVVYSLSIPEVQKLLEKIDFLNQFDFNKKWSSKKITLNGITFNIDTNLQKFTISQYIDFQTFWNKKDNMKYMANLLSTILIPKGKKYNEDYDISEITQTIEEYLPITTANSILYFFLKDLLTSIRALQICLDWKLKRMEKKSKSNKEQLMKVREMTEKMFQEVFNGLL